MNTITRMIKELHAALENNDHLGVLYQVQGNLVDGTGERVYWNGINRAAAEAKKSELEQANQNLPWGGGFRVVVAIAE